ncbi:MAG: hypothetical protein ABIH00_10610 [Armatimonadota bacterium]
MNKKLIIPVVIVILFSFIAVSAFAGEKPQYVDKIKKFIEESEILNEQIGGDLWILKFTGVNIKNIRTVVFCANDLVIFQSLMCKAADVDLSKDFYKEMVDLSNQFDKCKFIVTDDGYVMVRIDSSARLMDLQGFKDDAEQSAAAVNEAWPAISKFLKEKE